MDRNAIKTLATGMLQNRTSIEALYFDEVLDGLYSFTLVDAVPSYARRGATVISTVSPTKTYQLPTSWRSLDADYAYFNDTRRISVYTSVEQWLRISAPNPESQPGRALLRGVGSLWFIEFDSVPAVSTIINVPGTFYRAALPEGGVPNFNEAMALVYGLVLHIALLQSFSDIAKDAQAGFQSQIGLLKDQYASERASNTLPPARDF